MLLVPVTQLMISNWGWSPAYVGLAVITGLLVIPPVLFFCRASPPRLPAGGAGAKRQPKNRGQPTGRSSARSTNSAFWLLFIARTLASMGNQIIVTHQIAHAVDVGYAKVFAASIFGLMGVISIGGRILFGYLADVMKRELVFTWVQIISAVGILALLGDARHLDALAALCLRGLLRARPGLARAGAVGDLGGYFSRQTFRRDLRLLYLQHRPRRRRRRLARRLSLRHHA